ncbi:MAG: cryptochrome/photolyase family protein [Cyclobacteriaceae bacterium]|nr:cryptochrome/photolyase family protein [Cyclobacteriaceae bacterium]
MEAVLIFPHQLFSKHPALKAERVVFLIEDDLFFGQYPFHQQKLVLHRASMKHYEANLKSKGYTVQYLDHAQASNTAALYKILQKQKVRTIHYADTVDYLLERRLKRGSQKNGIELIQYPSPNFICSTEFIDQFFQKKKRYFQTEFYIELRKQKNILLESDNPVGGSWTYDVMNRSRLPKDVQPPALPENITDTITEEAIRYVKKNFTINPGKVASFNYPVTVRQAEKMLDDFLKHRLHNYGQYQDAIVPEQSFLFHSVLTPALNIGLLSPEEIIRKAEKYFHQHDIPVNSAEGFIRQVLGWREFIRAVYIREGVKELTMNYWKHTRKIPSSFYTGTTGIEPIDRVINRLLETGYSNHIERLMVLGNFMLLCEFNPDDVYRWFMELYIDAYDWVMVPNVYGMSQFADGGLMATKPYISSSNYILKMSHYKKGEWCTVWDGLYWRFIDKHKNAFIKNPRMSMMVKQLEKMDPKKKTILLKTAEDFLKSLSKTS